VARQAAQRTPRPANRQGRRHHAEDAIEIADKQSIFIRRFDARLREELRGLVTDALIEEHRVTNGKRRSDALERVLTFFRRAAVADKYAILAVRPFAEYRIVALPAAAACRRGWSTTRCSPRPRTRSTACSSSACRT